jgi:hypothetical protein
MKLLCLHGYATNGEVLENQLRPILEALGGDHELVMVEGETSVGASEFTGGFAPPYLCYCKLPHVTPKNAGLMGQPDDSPHWQNIEKAHDLIHEAIEVDGPFDGLVGFSQGAGLAMSYMMHQKITNPDAPSEFKFAIMFSTSSLQSPDPEYNRQMYQEALEAITDSELIYFHDLLLAPSTTKQQFMEAPFMKRLSQREQDLLMVLGWIGHLSFRTRTGLRIMDKVERLEELAAESTARDKFPRFYHPICTPERVDIPTVHCWGRNDSEALQGSAVMGYELCSTNNAINVTHSGRHELPTRREDVDAAAKAIEKVFYLGEQQHAIAVI